MAVPSKAKAILATVGRLQNARLCLLALLHSWLQMLGFAQVPELRDLMYRLYGWQRGNKRDLIGSIWRKAGLSP